MRITIKGQVTIPQKIRDYAGFQPGTEVDFIIGEDGIVQVLPAGSETALRQARLDRATARLRDSADVRLGTDAIMALIRG